MTLLGWPFPSYCCAYKKLPNLMWRSRRKYWAGARVTGLRREDPTDKPQTAQLSSSDGDQLARSVYDDRAIGSAERYAWPRLPG